MKDGTIEQESMDQYAIPVRRSLLKPKLIFGMSKMGIGLLGAQVLGFVLFLQIWAWLIVVLAQVFLIRYATKKDPYFAEVLIVHSKEPDDFCP